MNLKQLMYFRHVAELGSFTQAAQVLGVAQSAVSRQVRRLEVNLHQNLLVREGRGVTPTAAGRLLLEHCRGILHQVERAQQDLARARGTLAGRVTLGLAPSASRALTVSLTHRFRERLPDATLSISEGLSLILEEWLLAGRLDIAVVYNPPASADLELLPLTSERLYLVGQRTSDASADPVRLQALAHIPLVIPNRPHTVRMLLESQMILIGRQLNVRLEIDGVAPILDLVADGAGYAVLTRHAILTSGQPERFHLRPIENPELHSRLYLATARQRFTTPTQKIMQELIQATVRDVYPPRMVVPHEPLGVQSR